MTRKRQHSPAVIRTWNETKESAGKNGEIIKKKKSRTCDQIGMMYQGKRNVE